MPKRRNIDPNQEQDSVGEVKIKPADEGYIIFCGSANYLYARKGGVVTLNGALDPAWLSVLADIRANGADTKKAREVLGQLDDAIRELGARWVLSDLVLGNTIESRLTFKSSLISNKADADLGRLVTMVYVPQTKKLEPALSAKLIELYGSYANGHFSHYGFSRQAPFDK
jgi:hypothetical protein